ncbi:hypothetical protein ONE63_009163 [Megalurothrips usitatus]|uniref:Cytochrome P450 4C1-like n=1 Tax=Megalurothrips usitatus TaxID=439358 RepID=A0AAV7XNH8_9NEOP|nr:hypothetical protein ONE63_009163 [Megalurothrips usitatus]
MAVAVALVLFAAVAAATRALLLAAGWWRAVRRAARVSASIPGPPPRPIVGNFLDVSRGRLQNSFQVRCRLLARYGFLIRFWLGPFLVVFVFDAKDAEAVVTAPSCSGKPGFVYRLAEPIIGRGLVSLSGAEHRRHRKLILPSLHRDILNQFQPLMLLSAEELAAKLAAKADTGEVFDVTPLAGAAALDSAFRTLLNAESGAFEASRQQREVVVRFVDRVSELIMYRLLRPWFHPDRLFRWSSHHAEYTQLLGVYDDLILDVLESKLATPTATPPAAAPEAPRRRKRQAFLDHVLATEEARSLSRDELFGELKTMASASFATSQDTLSVQLLLLSLLPDVQAKIHDELDDVLGPSDRPLELADLEHLDYMERFIKEALRYYPPFPVVGRECAEDLPLPSGHTLPAGCLIALSPFATQHNPEYFPEPKRFDPDRFLPEAVAARPPCAFLAFSAGPRNCIGARYAMLFLKTHLACVLRRLAVLPDPAGPRDIARIRMRMGVTYYPRDGANVRMQARAPRQPRPQTVRAA